MINLEIVSVNYNTPDLIENLIKSIEKHENDVPIRIIDGSDKQPFINEIIEVCSNRTDVTLERQHYNIHHGGGMHKALMTSSYEWILFMDSDCSLNGNFTSKLQFTHYIEGFPCWVDRNGINTPKGKGFLYIHPEIFLINVERYQHSKYNFIRHGAPSIEVMLNTDDLDKLCMPEEYRELYNRGGRGTVNRFGYQL